ncbi:hypothetical protein [Hoeflea sp.]|uniref:hypothetical protein n=1 Tax=Hoeflea sp. TaxID=1940281 RepID=UPI00374A643E
MVYGDGAANNLNGRGGNDTLYGLAGNGFLLGEAEADRFVFNTAPSDRNPDVIGDFVSGLVTIGLHQLYFGSADDGGGAPRLTLSAAAEKIDATLLFDTSKELLLFDDDGTGLNAAQPFVYLSKVNLQHESDFYFV